MEMVGKVYDVVSLFSTKQRDFLIRNNGEKVKVDSLKGKIVAILFVSLAKELSSFQLRVNRPIKEVYDDLSPVNNFEVVFVAQVVDGDESEDNKLFDKFFSTMPWLAIPQDDKESRRELLSMLGSKLPPVCPILDDKGKVLTPSAIRDFNDYGAEYYPFTPERKIEIDDDDMSARFEMSLKRLLTSDFLIRSNSEKVPVSDLEGKVVAFYFYSGYESRFVDALIDLYEKLWQMGKQFEVVFLNPHLTDEKLFMEAFKRTPWLRLPSNDRSYLKLPRICHSDRGDLVIFRPGEKFPDTYGLDVIDHFGIEAYPFTRKRVIEMEVERLKSMTLESMLFSGRCKYIQGKGGEKITAHHLVNKTILLLFTEKRCSRCHRLVPRLITWYNETKERVKEDVEIIHIPYDYSPAKKCNYETMPWLQFPYDAKFIKKLFQKTLGLYRRMPLIIAFGADGKIVNMNLERKFLSEEWETITEYPFTFTLTDVDLFSEVERNVASKMSWPVEEDLHAKMFSPLNRDEYEEMQREMERMKKTPWVSAEDYESLSQMYEEEEGLETVEEEEGLETVMNSARMTPVKRDKCARQVETMNKNPEESFLVN